MLTVSKHARYAIAALAMAALPATADAQSVEPPEHLYVQYSGSVLILKVANISLSAGFNDGVYSAGATFESGGLLRWFDDTNIEATSNGYRQPEGLSPYRYEHINHASNKGRVVGINFDEGVAMPDVQPPFGSMGEPPASDEERTGALDPISTLLSLMTGLPNDEHGVCEGRLPVFDGKARYNLRLNNLGLDDVRTRAWSGEAIRCQAFIEPISGYDDGDRPDEDETRRPVTIWLAPVNGVNVPVRFRAQTQIGAITIQATQLYAGDATQ